MHDTTLAPFYFQSSLYCSSLCDIMTSLLHITRFSWSSWSSNNAGEVQCVHVASIIVMEG